MVNSVLYYMDRVHRWLRICESWEAWKVPFSYWWKNIKNCDRLIFHAIIQQSICIWRIYIFQFSCLDKCLLPYCISFKQVCQYSSSHYESYCIFFPCIYCLYMEVNIIHRRNQRNYLGWFLTSLLVYERMDQRSWIFLRIYLDYL